MLQTFLSTGDRRCAFLTATPRNKTVWDIYNQIRLFHGDLLIDMPVDPPHLRRYFKLVDAGERRLRALLTHLLIRRTRSHILRWYGYDAETDQRVDPGERLNEEAMYTIYTQGEIGLYEEDEVDEFIDLHEAEETVRQLKEDDPHLYRRIVNLRDGVRCGRQAGRSGAVVLCRAGRYRQLLLVDEAGDVLSRDVPRILNRLKCDPDTPAQPLPQGYNRVVMGVKGQFDREVQARQAEREHTLSLTRAQRYVLRQLRLLYDDAADEDLRSQIAVLEATFRQPDPRPAVRGELNRIQREKLTGMGLLDALSSVYHLYGLEIAQPRRGTGGEGNEGLPRIVCSEAVVE